MAEKYRSNNLLIRLMKRSRLSWFWTTTVVAVVLILLLVMVAYLEGYLNDGYVSSFWGEYLDAPVTIIYILAIYPFIIRRWDQAVHAFQPLLSLEDDPFNKLLVNLFSTNRRREWAAVVIGAVFWLVIRQPWSWSITWGPGELWFKTYDVITHLLMFGLLGWLIYSSIIGTIRLTRLSRQHLNLDIFDATPLKPFAQFGLSLSLAFAGGISLSVPFRPLESLLKWENIAVYAVLICVAVLVFFLSMRSIHNAMVKAKKHELDLARKHIVEASHKLKDRVMQGQLERMEEVFSATAGWSAYEKVVLEAPEWPFDAGIIRKLSASGLMPAAFYVFKILASRLGLPLPM